MLLSLRRPLRTALVAATLVFLATPSVGRGQQVPAGTRTRVRDLIVPDDAVPVRLVGYGLVTGLDGSGDRSTSGLRGGVTVQSVANLLHRFGMEVPPDALRTQNVAVVMVTAEVSPYLRPGGRFDLHVSSLGDARSLRGGVLWMTPLLSDAGEAPVATGQGSLLLAGPSDQRRTLSRAGELTARIPRGGIIEGDLPRPVRSPGPARLALTDPDLGTASRIADAINAAVGAGTATVEDPGAVLVMPRDSSATAVAAFLTNVALVEVAVSRAGRVVIDARDGTVVAGGELPVGPAVVTTGVLTLAVGAPAPVATLAAPVPVAPDAAAAAVPPTTGGVMQTPAQGGFPSGTPAPGGAGTPAVRPSLAATPLPAVRLPAGTPVAQIAALLREQRATGAEIAAVLTALRDAGALSAAIVVR